MQDNAASNGAYQDRAGSNTDFKREDEPGIQMKEDG